MESLKKLQSILVTDDEWSIIKAKYKIINYFIKWNHINILTLDGVFFSIIYCGVVDIKVENRIVCIIIWSKQQ